VVANGIIARPRFHWRQKAEVVLSYAMGKVILFISRKYPPSIGGMERVSYRLTTEIARRRDARIIAWGRSQKGLPLFAISAFVRALALGFAGDVEVIHLGDPALGLLGYLLGRILRVPVVVTVHGLDLIYPNWLYQQILSRVLPTFDAVVAISRASRAECLKRGVQPARCYVVTIGVDPPSLDLPDRAEARNRLAPSCGLALGDRDVLLTTGRLVRRKGVAWFVAQVLPSIIRLRPTAFYLVVGTGPDEGRIRAAIEQAGLTDRVRLFGEVPNETLWDAYCACNLFVMPNIAVVGDMEGFGLVAIEAGLAERYVVASDLEGIRDAIVPPFNGDLVSPGDSTVLAETIANRLADRDELEDLGRGARRFVTTRFGWTRIIDEYLQIIDGCRRSSIKA
jgi:phosphatidylinositol alpha-1,6-mannosyltransferase